MKDQVSSSSRVSDQDTHQSRQQRPPDIETQPVWDVADLRYIRRKSVAAGVINEYHHAA
jgi:putative transposase